jgi:hypothetical protein
VVQSTADESRTVSFGRGEASFGADGVARLEGRFFVTGALILWSIDPSGLSNLEASARFFVTAGDSDESLYASDLNVGATDEGGVDVVAGGGLITRTVDLEELEQLGADPASLAVLADVEARGQLLIVVIPTQSHEYAFTATEDEPLVLNAGIELALSNTTGETGVAATIGRPFSNLAAFIHSAMPEIDGEAIQAALNKAISSDQGGPIAPGAGIRSPCGAMGVELLLPALVLCWARLATLRRGLP